MANHGSQWESGRSLHMVWKRSAWGLPRVCGGDYVGTVTKILHVVYVCEWVAQSTWFLFQT